MPDPGDLLKALRGLPGQPDAMRKLIEQVIERQAAFERDLVERVTAPVGGVLGLLEESAAAMRAQAKAFDAAAVSFKQASELLEVQAGLLETARASVRDPVGAVRSAGATAARRRRRK